MLRPVGIFILAVLDFMGTIFLTLYGLMLRLGMFGSLAFLVHFAILSPFGQLGMLLLGSFQITVMRVLGWGSLNIVVLNSFFVLVFVFAAIAGVAGYGMLKLKGWARIANIVFAILGMIAHLLWFFLPQLFSPSMIARIQPHNFVSFIYLGVHIAINGLILWYLMRPPVRAAFVGGRSATAQARVTG